MTVDELVTHQRPEMMNKSSFSFSSFWNMMLLVFRTLPTLTWCRNGFLHDCECLRYLFMCLSVICTSSFWNLSLPLSWLDTWILYFRYQSLARCLVSKDFTHCVGRSLRWLFAFAMQSCYSHTRFSVFQALIECWSPLQESTLLSTAHLCCSTFKGPGLTVRVWIHFELAFGQSEW